MGKYILKRLGLAFVTTFIILSITFILVKLLPMEKAVGGEDKQIAYYENQVGLGYVCRFKSEQSDLGELLFKTSPQKTDNPLEKTVTYYYYKVPTMKQYGNWLKNIVTKWEWGYSRRVTPNVRASVIILSKLPYSIKINIWAVLLSVPLGILLGIWAALKKNSFTDHAISTMVMVFISIPGFVLITFLMKAFCYDLRWLPSKWPSDNATVDQKFLGYIIPVFCLSFGSICGYCRYVRAELCEVMESEFLLLARTKGLTRKQAIVRHALKNAMVPLFPSILSEIVGLLGGSMILEKLYNIPGIGRLFIDSLSAKDYDLLFVDMALFTVINLVSGVFLDCSYGLIDPRIRMGAKK